MSLVLRDAHEPVTGKSQIKGALKLLPGVLETSV